MYRFRDLSIGVSEGMGAPSDNMRVNGVYLNVAIPGYRQLAVSGRGLMERELDSVAVLGRAGVFVRQWQYKPRVIRVDYILEAPSSSELHQRFTLLNKYLTGELKLKFEDEPTWEYTAYLSSVDEPKETKLSLIASFQLLCPNPFKVGELQRATNGQVRLVEALEVVPSKIVATVTKSGQTLELTCRNCRMRLEGHYIQGRKLVMEQNGDDFTLKYDGRNVLHELQYFSELEEFKAMNGDVVRGVNVSIDLVEWRDYKL